jgi:hypothetical protein
MISTTVLFFTETYGTNNDTIVGTGISNNQSRTNSTQNQTQAIILQNSDGKLDAQITPFSNATKVVKNGTLEFDGSEINVPYEQIGGLKIMDGDTILASKIVQGKAALDRFIDAEPWTNGIIPVVINSDIPNQQRIIDALNYVQTATPVRFEPVSVDANGEILNSHYIRFVQAPVSDDSCYTFAGMVSPQDSIFTDPQEPFYPDGRYHGQPIVVASWCGTDSLVHEIGHDLGLWHEQKRCDRDEYIEIDWDNIEEDAWSQYATLCDPEQPSRSPESFGNYDYCSIMHYKQFSGFAIDGSKPVYEITKPVVGCEEEDIGKSQVYSPTDIEAIKSVYSFVE